MGSYSIGFMTAKSNISYYNRSGTAAFGAGSAYLDRKNAASEASAKDRSQKLKDLDRQRQSVSVHSLDMTGLSADEAHKKLLNLKREQNTFKSTATDKSGGFLKLSQAKSTSKDENIKKHLEYNYKDISAMIRQAKTSSSAGQAAIKAKRKVLELRRKAAASTDNDEKAEISAALNHARSMERVAKKKKRHLETEELVENTMKQDEKLEELTGKPSSISGGSIDTTGIVSAAEDVVDDACEEIDEMQSQALQEFMSEDALDIEAEYQSIIPDDELMSDFDDFMEDFDEAYEMLDEVMENLEMLEVVDPHMDEDSFAQLKIKHRQSEEKDLVKADNDYLKAMFDKYEQDMARAKAGAAVMSFAAPTIGVSFAGEASAAEVSGMPAIDISI